MGPPDFSLEANTFCYLRNMQRCFYACDFACYKHLKNPKIDLIHQYVYEGEDNMQFYKHRYICANIFQIEFEDISVWGEEADNFLWQILIPQLKCSLWDNRLKTDFSEEKNPIVMGPQDFTLWKNVRHPFWEKAWVDTVKAGPVLV